MSIKIDFKKDSNVTKIYRDRANKVLNQISKEINKNVADLYSDRLLEYYTKETIGIIKRNHSINNTDNSSYARYSEINDSPRS